MKTEEDQKKTVGEASLELRAQEDEKINPIDLQRKVHAGHSSTDSYEAHLLEALERGKKTYAVPFFVVVLFKKERHLKNVVRQYFLCRLSCPTPSFDQTVYRYDPEGDELCFLWTVPDPQTTHLLYHNRADPAADHKELVEMCVLYVEGKLDIECARWNKEENSL